MGSTFLFIILIFILNGTLLQNETIVLFITKIDTVLTVITSPCFKYDIRVHSNI